MPLNLIETFTKTTTTAIKSGSRNVALKHQKCITQKAQQERERERQKGGEIDMNAIKPDECVSNCEQNSI